MDINSDLLNLQIHYQILDDKLKTEVNYSSNFFMLKDIDQVQIISALIDILNNTEIPESNERELKNLTESHAELITECSELFPFSSCILVDLSNKETAISVDFSHDSSIATLHPYHSLVLVDSIIKVLKATATMIVKKSTNKEAM